MDIRAIRVRKQLVAVLGALASKETIDDYLKNGNGNTFDELHWVLEFSGMLDDPWASVGTILKRGAEAAAVAALAEKVNELTGSVRNGDDKDYYLDRRWPEVMRLANRCLVEFRSSEDTEGRSSQ